MANLKVRGDDDVFALLNEMESGETSSYINTRNHNYSINNDEKTSNHAEDKPINLLINRHKIAFQLSPPSNPHVEIIRHRCHEKFKTQFFDAFRSCSTPTSQPDHASSSQSIKSQRNQYVKEVLHTIWREMPPHNIWERFQFSLKTLEVECIRGNLTMRGNPIPPWCQVPSKQYHDADFVRQLLFPSVKEILHWTENGRSLGIIWEPLLPVASISDSGTDEINQRYRNEALSIMREEIQFQFRRSMKQYLGSGGRRAKDAYGNSPKPITFDDLFSKLKEFVDCLPDDYSSNLSKGDKIEKAGREEKHEFMLDVLFQSPPFHNLVRKLSKRFHNLSEDTYSNFRSELRKCSNRLALEEQKQHQRQNTHHFSGGRKRKINIKNGRDITTPKISFLDDIEHGGDRQALVSFGGISLRINEFHLNKMKVLFHRNLRTEQSNFQFDDFFPCALFTTLLRYDALEGAGLQSAIPSSVFRLLNKKYGCDWECFASPFNCWLEKSSVEAAENQEILSGGKFGCAFGDTDAWFGGSGNFYGTDFLQLAREGSGCFQANPPFASNFIASMCETIDQILTESNKGDDGTPLMFIIFVPAWQESSGWKMLMKSSFLSKHILLSQKDDVHYYAEGTQHRRRTTKPTDLGGENANNMEKGRKGTTHRIASFDTSVFFFQNDFGRRKWLITGDDENLLKSAFSMQQLHESKFIDKKNPIKLLPGKEVATQNGVQQSNAIIRKKNKREKVRKGNSSSNRKKAKLVSGENDELGILKSLNLLRDGRTKTSINSDEKDHEGSCTKTKTRKKK